MLRSTILSPPQRHTASRSPSAPHPEQGPQLPWPSALLSAALLLLSSCAGWSPIPDRPKLAIEAIGAMLTPAGTASMQTPSALGPVNQPEVGLPEHLNLTDRQFGYGGDLSYGDDFAGISFGFFSWEQGNVSTKGILPYGFGRLAQGDEVQSVGEWQLYRLAWRVPVFETSFDVKSRTKLDLRLAAGLSLQHTEFRLRSEAQNAKRDNYIKIKDDYGFPLLSLRAEGEIQPLKLRLDLSVFDGKFDDIEGSILDASVTLHYQIQRGLSAWAGYWLYRLPAAGNQEKLGYSMDLELDGYLLGLRWEF
ncbi:MAG: hypothetical protein CSA62_02990 [Planctomycetota bacterium]|nr:MAG: hypothetical protein CSA62_02990 [Planctomycetota bacterium]